MKTLNRTDYKRIYDIACSEWKLKLQKLFAEKFAIEDEIQLKGSIYKTMRNACTKEQNELFDDIFGTDKKELEIGKWYTYSNNKYYLLCITEICKDGDVRAYGFIRNMYVNVDYDRFTTDNLIEATKEEVETRLKKEAIKRGFKEGVEFKTIDRLLHDGSISKGGGKIKITNINMCYYPSKKETTLLNNGWGTIFHNGKWAEIIKETEKTYKIGQRFKHINSKEKYILVQTETDKVSLIGLKSGNRWKNPVKVENSRKITAEELNKITDNLTEDFTLYKE